MERVRFITHKGKQVLLLDYNGLKDEAEALAMVEERKRLVTSQPKGSVLTVADINGAHLTKEALTKLRENPDVLSAEMLRDAGIRFPKHGPQ